MNWLSLICPGIVVLVFLVMIYSLCRAAAAADDAMGIREG